jgi:uncharacterized RDD family membrane protein YckC
MSDNDGYWVRGEDGEEYGPVELPELREWVGENRIGLGTEVRLDAPDGLWRPWQFYPELVALLAEARVTGLPSDVPILAPVGRRIAAFVLDIIMSFVLVLILWLMIYWLLPAETIGSMILYTQAVLQGLTPPPAPTLPRWFEVWANVIFLGVPALYYTGFHAAHGRTPAKSIFHIQVTDGQGRKPTLGRALIRALILVISVYFFSGTPLLYAFYNPPRRALNDPAAHTSVVQR